MRILRDGYLAGALFTGAWLAFIDHHGIEGARRLLLLPADLLLAAFWPTYWIGYALF